MKTTFCVHWETITIKRTTRKYSHWFNTLEKAERFYTIKANDPKTHYIWMIWRERTIVGSAEHIRVDYIHKGRVINQL